MQASRRPNHRFAPATRVGPQTEDSLCPSFSFFVLR